MLKVKYLSWRNVVRLCNNQLLDKPVQISKNGWDTIVVETPKLGTCVEDVIHRYMEAQHKNKPVDLLLLALGYLET